MAKLYFFYSVMNAGKTTHLLQARHNYVDHGGRVLVFTSSLDTRNGIGKVSSRIGIEAEAIALREKDNIYEYVRTDIAHNGRVAAVMIDEAQFMSAEQVEEASRIVDFLGVPVMAYGLKNNFKGEIFSPAVSRLLALADEINLLKSLCHCGKRATMILRYGQDGKIDTDGDVVEPGAEGRYISVCRLHYRLGDIGQVAYERLRAAQTYRVHCRQCGSQFGLQGYYDKDQAYRCAAQVYGHKIVGYYGSTVADMNYLEFVCRPADVMDGNACDDCISDWIVKGLVGSRSVPLVSLDDLLVVEDERSED